MFRALVKWLLNILCLLINIGIIKIQEASGLNFE